ncbi:MULTISPECIES: EAL domain-containing protein [Psychrilyobacter]|uniref:EAL domain-containing protein n=1 Tax=Psychrilyobacter piezotolerans TaxID=2293438 RepID=A0ABX9KJG4_9FUSO|nr:MULTISPECIES: EAL domain-containing protein [Psychrilyobacter]MCS5421758.1 EAL domain-containing protein [Psychrilyobacter sp. S5]NDI77063.1 EAL domain-containing protein [Psychrilyobacter piezotolerans]RDE64679.1 EAL domain-containing protein [Psychrilyobacter sp. S5]REI42491.1 EAL domain-containing protein [Psychrilyobacter piezotolerans]
MILLITKEKDASLKKMKTLENLGYEALHTSSPEKALDLIINNKKINLVVIDINSIHNYIIFIENILAIRDIPIIYITSTTEKSPIEKINSACYGYLHDDSNDFIFDSTIKMAFNLFEKNERKNIYKSIFENHHAAMLVIDPKNDDIIQANPAAINFYGWNQKELTGMKITDLNILSKDKVHTEMQLAKSKKKNHFSFRHKLSNGAIKDVEVHAGSIVVGGKTRLLSIVNDVTKRKQAEKTIERLAYFDSLTSLPNRKMFFDNFPKAIIRAEQNNLKVALLYIDLDSFKDINDSFGHPTGDQLLVEVAKLFKKNLHKNNTVFRLGGDEFAITVENISNSQEGSKVADKLLSLLKNPFTLENNKLFSFASIGISIYPDDGLNVDTLLKNSDIAMYQAKNNGKNNYLFYTSKMNEIAKRKITIETNLRHALKNEELTLFYQPKIDFNDGKITGAESLLRWFPNKDESIPPSEFIPIAETSGLILEVDKWVLSTVCRQLKKWKDLGYPDQKISVNVSGMHFKQGRILKTLGDILDEIEIPPKSLEIEITEGIFLEDIKESALILEQLQSMGIDISVDDFGTGYSSFGYLKRLPVSTLKIDRSFISNAATNSDDASITKAIIMMAKLLNLKVIAEGVETIEQVELLHAEGCHEMQGYYFAKPMSIDKYEIFLDKL